MHSHSGVEDNAASEANTNLSHAVWFLVGTDTTQRPNML